MELIGFPQNIKRITGIPYNPQGQGIVERAHATLKMQIAKLKKGKGIGNKEVEHSPEAALHTACLYQALGIYHKEI